MTMKIVYQASINFGMATKKPQKHNSNWQKIYDHPYGILITKSKLFC